MFQARENQLGDALLACGRRHEDAPELRASVLQSTEPSAADRATVAASDDERGARPSQLLGPKRVLPVVAIERPELGEQLTDECERIRRRGILVRQLDAVP